MSEDTMNKESEIKKQRAKAWCLDTGITANQIIQAWERAVNAGNLIIRNLASHGYQWWWLPPHLLKELVETYGDLNAANRFTYFSNGKWRLRIGDTEFSGAAVNRLAAYENTGIEPNDLCKEIR